MKKILSNLIGLITKFSWLISGYILGRQYSSDSYPGISDIKQALVIIPHADDEWIGCSRILERHRNTILLYMNMQGGNNTKERIIRHHELKQISSLLDLELYSTNENKENELKCAIYKFRPSHIFIPFCFDWHEDHIKCMQSLRAVLQNYHQDVKIAMYQVSLPILPTNLITHIEGMSKMEWKHKWNVFVNVYRSQLDIPYFRFGINERVLSLNTKYYAAEAYSVQGKEQWLRNLDAWILREDEKKRVKDKINHLIYLYTSLKEFSSIREWI